MSVMTHSPTLRLRARGVADEKESVLAGTLGSSHVAMIKRSVKFAVMVSGFFLLLVAVMAVKYAAFFLRLSH